jgi:hypothetical protein
MERLIAAPHSGNHTMFVSGPPGAGKTSLGVRRLAHLLEAGVPAEQILVMVPQRTLATPYYDFLQGDGAPPGVVVDVATVGGLARRTLDLFWPLVAGKAGFSATQRPRFLNVEGAQYYMARVAEPFLAAGAFEGVSVSRVRLVTQILDNLNKASAAGFGPDEIAARLKAAWGGESARLRIYDQVQELAMAFRQACIDGNLLDWSLQIEVFWKHLLPLSQMRRYLLSGYRHLIVDNTEEDIPAAHDLLRQWLELAESALVLYDTGGGYRLFMGADPRSALSLAGLCQEQVVLSESHVAPPEVEALGAHLAAPFLQDAPPPPAGVAALPALEWNVRRFFPEMLDWVAAEVSRLIMEGNVPPGEIAILAPYLGDALRFALRQRLERYGIEVRTHRPGRELGEEPAARCLITLARLAHPAWRRPPHAADVAQALGMSIADLDPIRASLLTGIVYRVRDGQPVLSPFHQIVPEMQERVSFLLGGRYDELWRWLEDYIEMEGQQATEEGLDHFLSRLYGEVLSQPGFGFHGNYDAGVVATNLVDSIRNFRRAVAGSGEAYSSVASVAAPQTTEGASSLSLVGKGAGGEGQDLALEYVDMLERGIVAAQYLPSWTLRPRDAVLLVPAYTLLMMNQPVTVQFWLDAGSRTWMERVYQPLTHPYVLRRDWEEGEVWADAHEIRAREEALGRVVVGLSRRARKRIYLAIADLNERGYEQQGPLRQSLQRLLRRQPRGS